MRTRDPVTAHQYCTALTVAVSQLALADQNAEKQWECIRNAIHGTSMVTFGRKGKKSEDWFEANWDNMEPVVTTKRQCLLAYKRNPSRQNLNSLQEAKALAQRTARQCAND
jgi:hypothetical protein